MVKRIIFQLSPVVEPPIIQLVAQTYATEISQLLIAKGSLTKGTDLLAD
jgi:hypothetical protein